MWRGVFYHVGRWLEYPLNMGAFKNQTRPDFIYLRIVRYCDHEPILLFVVTNHRLRIHPLPAGEGEPPPPPATISLM